ncbi:MAG: cysteine hydrolase family protein [Dongiaceae bacterium]
MSAEKPYDGEGVLARVAALLDRARTRGAPVLHVQHDGGPGDLLGKPDLGWDIHPDVAPRPDEPVIGKTRCSAFPGTELDAHLNRLGITRLVIAGMQTEYCIDTNCRAAFDLGYKVVLAKDGHTTFDTPVPSADQNNAHHNRTHDGSFVQLAAAGDIDI